MKRLHVLVALFSLLLAGCRKPEVPKSHAVDAALAERVAALEDQVDRLQKLVVVLDQRKPPVTRPRTVVVANTNLGAQAEIEHRQYEEVMQSLAEAVENLREQEQGMNEQVQAITEAITFLEQAVISIDAELRQLQMQL